MFSYRRRWKKSNISFILFLTRLIYLLILPISLNERHSTYHPFLSQTPRSDLWFLPLSPSKLNHENSLQHYLLYASHICLHFVGHYSLFLFLWITFCWVSFPQFLPVDPIFHMEASIIFLNFKTDHFISPMKTPEVNLLLL